jgi:hypothetical protein
MTDANRHGARTASGMAVLAAAALLAGCGGGTSLGTAQLTQLRSDIAAARTGAANRDPAAVEAALTALQGKVESLRSAGALSPSRAAGLVTEIGQARARVPSDVVPAPPTPPAASAPVAPGPAQPPAPGDRSVPGHDNGNGNGKDHAKDHGKAKGKGHGKGNGDGGD